MEDSEGKREEGEGKKMRNRKGSRKKEEGR